LKEIGEYIGLQDSIIKTQFRGANEIQNKKFKFELLTSHTARRTFVTLSLEKGMRPEMVMSITGHK
jgi:integrase